MTTLRSKTTLNLASDLATAIEADMKPEVGGFDLAAGMVGPGVSEWLRKVASQLDQNAIAIERAKGVLRTLDVYSMFDRSGTEADDGLVRVKDDAVMLLKQLVAGPALPASILLEAVDSSQLVTELRDRGHVLSVWNDNDLEFLDTDDATQDLTEPQLDELKQRFLNDIGGKLVDSLGSAGNEAISTFWLMAKSDLIAQVVAISSSQEADEAESPTASIESVRGG